jgi:hypothetical protein
VQAQPHMLGFVKLTISISPWAFLSLPTLFATAPHAQHKRDFHRGPKAVKCHIYPDVVEAETQRAQRSKVKVCKPAGACQAKRSLTTLYLAPIPRPCRCARVCWHGAHVGGMSVCALM